MVLNYRFSQELNREPIFEQVTPSGSSGKRKKLGEDLPPGGLKSPKYAGSNRVDEVELDGMMIHAK